MASSQQDYAQHRLIAIENKFTAGSNATGGRFTTTIPGLGFVPDGYYIRHIAYDGADNLSGALLISCVQLMGPIGFFLSANSQGAAVNGGQPQNNTPGTQISNSQGLDIGGQMVEFTVTQGGVGQTLLSGRLSIMIEAYRRKPNKDERKA